MPNSPAHNHENPVVITHAVRTPIGKFLGALSRLGGPELGAAAVRGLLKSAGFPPLDVEYLIFGNARQAGSGPNPARQIAIRAGVRESAPAFTVNQACASGLKAIMLASDAIRLGRAHVVVAGGTESMSNLPYMLPKMRAGYRLGHGRAVDGMVQDGFLCPMSKMVMGETAEKLAKMYKISREEQDQYALNSQQKCEAARKAGRFKNEIVPVEATDERGEVAHVDADEHPRDGCTLESLAKLPPAFDAQTGTVTAGNACGITDGAAALLLMQESTARRRGLPILAKIGAAIETGVDPSIMGIGPVPAVRELLVKTNRTIESFDLIELNEAFAAQAIACDRDLNFPADRLNVNGGAIALGHPIGCTGARIVTTLLHEMRHRNSKKGLATLCVSGGMGVALELLH